MNLRVRLFLIALAALFFSPMKGQTSAPTSPVAHPAVRSAYFGGGCFWCLEAYFETLPGVSAVVSGYAGGHTVAPTYREVCGGGTGHAEVVRIDYDPEQITYEALLEKFWLVHDPTTLDRQGPDEGPQYRSIIIYADDGQRAAAEGARAAVQTRFAERIVTEIVPLAHFYAAEEYHQNYFRRNPNQGYCRAVIAPKLKKLGVK